MSNSEDYVEEPIKYQAFLHHFGSMGGWLKGSWGGWVVVMWIVVEVGGRLGGGYVGGGGWVDGGDVGGGGWW